MKIGIINIESVTDHSSRTSLLGILAAHTPDEIITDDISDETLAYLNMMELKEFYLPMKISTYRARVKMWRGPDGFKNVNRKIIEETDIIVIFINPRTGRRGPYWCADKAIKSLKESKNKKQVIEIIGGL